MRAVQADAPLAGHRRRGDGATGALSGDVASGPGKSGSGAVFNGGTVTGPPAVDMGSDFTVSAWGNLSAPVRGANLRVHRVGAARKAGVTTAFFPGSVDEVRFHDRVLTSDEVFEFYRGEA